jgi:hypothetical protein
MTSIIRTIDIGTSIGEIIFQATRPVQLPCPLNTAPAAIRNGIAFGGGSNSCRFCLPLASFFSANLP